MTLIASNTSVYPEHMLLTLWHTGERD